MQNTKKSIFYPFSQYNNDISTALGGLVHVYPSRYMTGTLSIPRDQVESVVEKISDTMKEMAGSNRDIPYANIRQSGWSGIYDLISIKDSKIDEGAISIGDINFLSHETQNGLVYSDIYINIGPAIGSKTAVLQKESGEDPKKPSIAIDPVTGKDMMIDSYRKNMTFDVIVLYYNIYRIDPTTKTADFVPLALDMPLGIYLPEEDPVSIKVVDKEDLYGAGTSWSTRICSRFISSSANNHSSGNPVSTEKASEYATLTKVLSEFGSINSQIQQMIHTKDRDYFGTSPDDVKSYLEEFRNERHTNVPYIKDGFWFVNGRKVGQAEPDWDTIGKIIEEKVTKKVIEELERVL